MSGPGAGGDPPPSPIPWPPIVLLGTLLSALLAGALVPLPWPDGTVGAAMAGLGGLLVAAAIAIDAWAIVTLARGRTTVLPNRASAALVTAGPFARSRNPIYLANAVLLAGLGLLLGNAWFLPAAAAAVVLTTRLAIVPEERHLAARFGAAYEAYSARVPRWI